MSGSHIFFSRMRSEGSRFTLGVWGWGCVRPMLRLCPQPSATAVNRPRVRRKALLNGECIWRGLESESRGLVTSQLFWRLQRRCQCEWSVAPQLSWHLRRRSLCEWSMSYLFWRLQRRCLREWSASPQFEYVLMAFAEEVSAWVLCGAAVGVCGGGVCVSDLCRRRNYFGFCRGGVAVGDLWRPTRVSSKNVSQNCLGS